jgi:S-disulfanyl-L-cysteine oxidoreductase SoxD
MPIHRLRLVIAVAIVSASAGLSVAAAEMPTYGVGRAPTTEEIKAWDLTIPPDGRGLPPGSGTAAIGKGVFEEKCAPCHGPQADDPKYRLLVGRFRPLTAAQLPESIDPFVGGKPVLTIGNYWQYATTLWSYIRRAQPFDEPGSLSPDQVYAVTAYLLYLNGIVGEQDVLDTKTLPQIKMPNRDGFVPESVKGTKPGTSSGKGAR